MTDREMQLTEALVSVIRQIDRLSVRLAANGRPGHVDYINKTDAANWAEAIADEARGALAVVDSQ